jgi:hypothetical protein
MAQYSTWSHAYYQYAATKQNITIREASVLRNKKGTGYCVHCGGVATKEVLFHQKDGVVLERYCGECAGIWVTDAGAFTNLEAPPNG